MRLIEAACRGGRYCVEVIWRFWIVWATIAALIFVLAVWH